MKQLYFLITLLLSNIVIADEMQQWIEENCRPIEAIFETTNQELEGYQFTTKFVKGNEADIKNSGDIWYDPLCDKSSVNIKSKSLDVTIKLDNGYEPVVKAIYIDGNKKLALIEHFSGGTAGKYTYVISLQDGKEEQVLDRLKAKEYIQTLNKSGKVIFNK